MNADDLPRTFSLRLNRIELRLIHAHVYRAWMYYDEADWPDYVSDILSAVEDTLNEDLRSHNGVLP